MARISLTKTREIVDDFAKEIKKKMIKKGKPSLHVINFRGEMREGKERPVVKVPIDCLRYRMENGRISSDVLDYMRNVGPLDEKDDDSQAIIRGFLKRKDPEITAEK